jgi:hypothetical protein
MELILPHESNGGGVVPVGDSVGIAAGDETTGPPSGANVTAQAAWCDLDVRVGSPLRHLKPIDRTQPSRRRRPAAARASPSQPGGPAAPAPGRVEIVGAASGGGGTGGGHRPSVEYAHLSGGIRLGLCGMRKGILIDCRTTTNQPWGARRRTNGNGSHLKFQPKSEHSPEVGELIIGMLTIPELRGAIISAE